MESKTTNTLAILGCLCNIWFRNIKKVYVGLRFIFCSDRTSILVIALSIFTLIITLSWSSQHCNTATITLNKSRKPGNGPISYEELKRVLDTSFKCQDNPGMVVIAVKDGKTILSESYGETLPGSGVKVTPDTRFQIGSLTKAFTAALLVDVFASNPRNQSYRLGTPLRDILGKGFRFADDQRTKYGSAADLLSHRIGLPNSRFMRFNPAGNRSDFLQLVPHLKTDIPFRARSRYSSVGFVLAAAITEILGGKTWEELAEERLFQPLGMSNTGFTSSTNFSHDDVAKPYTRNKGVVDPTYNRVWNSRCGSGCIVSSGNDMARWMDVMLTGRWGKNWEFPAGRIRTLTKVRTHLPSSTMSLITKPAFPVTSVVDQYALGWRHGFYNGHEVLSHSGTSRGYVSMMLLYPKENIGLMVAMNGNDVSMYHRLPLVHFISDYLLGESPWLNSTTICSFPAPWATPKKRSMRHSSWNQGLSPSLPHRQYTGTYWSALYGELDVRLNKSTSSLQAFYGVGSWQLLPQKETNTFYGKGMKITHFRNISGWKFVTADEDPQKVIGLIVRSFDAPHPPMFEKQFY